MSWFNNMEFNMESIQDGLTKGVAQVQNAVQNMDMKIDKSMLEKLTLTTPELRAERLRIDEEERRKEAVRDMLAGMLPWETRDTERDILVEECREAVLKLSTDKETFFGPYQMPKAVGLGKMKQIDGKEEENEKENENEEHEEEEEESTADDHKPSKESLEKLAKLEPLPPLLQNFDLDAHVGLIQKLFNVDPRLVGMQSKLSGGGEREKVFWRNYFFHCAFTRYEAGLSIDEIWSEDHAKPDQPEGTGAEVADAQTREETITFEKTQDPSESGENAFPEDPVTDADAPFSKATGQGSSNARNASFSESNDFEMVADDGDGDDADADVNDMADYELDELEAEIARELEE